MSTPGRLARGWSRGQQQPRCVPRERQGGSGPSAASLAQRRWQDKKVGVCVQQTSQHPQPRYLQTWQESKGFRLWKNGTVCEKAALFRHQEAPA